MTHRELCFDLARAKGTKYIEVPLENVWFNANYGKADVLTIKPSYTKFNLDIYECKVSKSDFNNEIRSGKYKIYYQYCHRIYFACPSGLININEIPNGIGLIIRGNNGWKTIKQATKRNIEIPYITLLSLLFYRGRAYNKRSYIAVYNDINSTYKKRLKGFGREIKNKILNYNNLELKFNNLLHEALNKIQFKNEEEENNFIEKWKNKNYISDY